MEVITRNEIVSHSDFDENVLPYFLSKGYEAFIKKSDNYLLFYSKTLNTLMPVRKYAVKSFALLQVIYPPISVSGARLSAKDEKQFLNEFTSLVKKKKLGIRVVQSYSYAVFKAVPTGSISCPFGTYVVNMAKHTEEELFLGIDPKGRNKIRNAQKNGVELKWGVKHVADFYKLYRDTMERSKMYYDPEEHFLEMAKQLGGNNVLCGVSYVSGKPQAGLFTPYTTYSGYYLHGAMAAKMDNPGAMDYLQWEAIRILKTKGVKQ